MSTSFYVELQLRNADADGGVVEYQRIADICDGVDEHAAFEELKRVLIKHIVEGAGGH